MLKRPGKLAATTFARRVREAPEGQLERVDGLSGRAVVATVFRFAPMQFSRRGARNAKGVVEWRISERDGGASIHTMLIEKGRCRIKSGPVAEPDLVLELEVADFLRLVAGATDAARLFGDGRLKIRGDLGFALRLPRMFRMP